VAVVIAGKDRRVVFHCQGFYALGHHMPYQLLIQKECGNFKFIFFLVVKTHVFYLSKAKKKSLMIECFM